MVDPAIVVARFATYGLAILAFGTAVYRTLIAPRGGGEASALVRVIASAALSLSALAYLALLGRQIAHSAGWPGADILRELADTTVFGRALVVTAAAAAASAAVGLAAKHARWPRAGLSGAALAALAFVGHAADGEGGLGSLRIATMALHLMAVGAWLGALPGLLSGLRASEPEAYSLLRRFGVLGGAAVAVVLLTGAGSLAFTVTQARGRLGTTYLAVLAAKLAAVLGLLILAAVNRFRLTPAFGENPCRALPILRRTIFVEQALAICAIGVVAWLGQLDPSM